MANYQNELDKLKNIWKEFKMDIKTKIGGTIMLDKESDISRLGSLEVEVKFLKGQLQNLIENHNTLYYSYLELVRLLGYDTMYILKHNESAQIKITKKTKRKNEEPY